jgi:hypothetical protein
MSLTQAATQGMMGLGRRKQSSGREIGAVGSVAIASSAGIGSGAAAAAALPFFRFRDAGGGGVA